MNNPNAHSMPTQPHMKQEDEAGHSQHLQNYQFQQQQQFQPAQGLQESYQQPHQQILGGRGVTIENEQTAPDVAFAGASNGNVGTTMSGGGRSENIAAPLPQHQQEQKLEQTAAEGVHEKFKGFLKQAKDNLPTGNKQPTGPNLGFKPTSVMAQRHEDALVSGKRPLYQFQVRFFFCSLKSANAIVFLTPR